MIDTDMLETIARVIGYHFWQIETDRAAIACGMDTAVDVMKALGGDEKDDKRERNENNTRKSC